MASAGKTGDEGAEEEELEALRTLNEGLELLSQGNVAAEIATNSTLESIRKAATQKAHAHHKRGFELINAVAAPGSPSSRALRRRLSVHGSHDTVGEFARMEKVARKISQEQQKRAASRRRKSSSGIFGFFNRGTDQDPDDQPVPHTSDALDSAPRGTDTRSDAQEAADGGEFIMSVISHVSNAVSFASNLDDPETRRALSANEQPPLHEDGRAALQSLGTMYDILTRPPSDPLPQHLLNTPRNLTLRETRDEVADGLSSAQQHGGDDRATQGQVEVTCIFTEGGRLGIKLAKGNSEAHGIDAPSGVSSSTSAYYAVVESISPHSMASDAKVPQGSYVSAVNSISVRGKSYTRVMKLIKEAAIKRPLTIVFRIVDENETEMANTISVKRSNTKGHGVVEASKPRTQPLSKTPLPPNPDASEEILSGSMVETSKHHKSSQNRIFNNNSESLSLLRAQLEARDRTLEECNLREKRLALELADKVSNEESLLHEITTYKKELQVRAEKQSSWEETFRKQVTAEVTSSLQAEWKKTEKENAIASENRLLMAIQKRDKMERIYKDRISVLERSMNEAEEERRKDAEEHEAAELRREAALQAASQKLVRDAVERSVTALKVEHIEEKVKAVNEAVERVSAAKNKERTVAIEAALNEAKVLAQKNLELALKVANAEAEAKADSRVEIALEASSNLESQWKNDMINKLENMKAHENRLKGEIESASERAVEVESEWKSMLSNELQDAISTAEARSTAREKEKQAEFLEEIEKVRDSVKTEVTERVSEAVKHRVVEEMTEMSEKDKILAVEKALAQAEERHAKILLNHQVEADAQRELAIAEAMKEAMASEKIEYEQKQKVALEHALQEATDDFEKILTQERHEAQEACAKAVTNEEEAFLSLRSEYSSALSENDSYEARVCSLEDTLKKQEILVAKSTAVAETAYAEECATVEALEKQLAEAREETIAERERGRCETEKAAAEVAAAELRAASEIAAALAASRQEAEDDREIQKAEIEDLYNKKLSSAVEEAIANERSNLEESFKAKVEAAVKAERENAQARIDAAEIANKAEMKTQLDKLKLSMNEAMTQELNEAARDKAESVKEAVASMEVTHRESLAKDLNSYREAHVQALEDAVKDAASTTKTEEQGAFRLELQNALAKAAEEKAAAIGELQEFNHKSLQELKAVEEAAFESYKAEEESQYNHSLEEIRLKYEQNLELKVKEMRATYDSNEISRRYEEEAEMRNALEKLKAEADAACVVVVNESKQKAESELADALAKSRIESNSEIQALKQRIEEERQLWKAQKESLEKDGVLEIEAILKKAKKEATNVSEKLLAQFELERVEHSKSKSMISELEQSEKSIYEEKLSLEKSLQFQIEQQRKANRVSNSEIADLRELLKRKENESLKRLERFRIECEGEREAHEASKALVTKLRSEIDAARAQHELGIESAQASFEKVQDEKKRSLEASSEAHMALTAELEKQMQEKDCALAELSEWQLAKTKAEEVLDKVRKEHKDRIGNERKAHEVTKGVLADIEIRMRLAETDALNAQESAKVAQSDNKVLKMEIENEKLQHRKSQALHESSKAEYSSELERLRVSLIAAHESKLKDTLEEERFIHRTALVKREKLTRVTWMGKMEATMEEQAAASDFAISELKANSEAELERAVSEARKESLMEASERISMLESEFQERLQRSRDQWRLEESRRSKEGDSRWSEEIRRVLESEKAAAKEHLSEEEQSWKASLVNALSQNEKKYTELLVEQRERLEHQSLRESQLAVKEARDLHNSQMKLRLEEADSSWKEKLEFVINEMSSKLEAEEEARGLAETSLESLEENFRIDFASKLDSAVEKSVLEGANVAREAAMKAAATELEMALRDQEERLESAWKSKLSNAVKAAVEETTTAAEEEGRIALEEAEFISSQRQAVEIMKAVTEATSIAMEEAAENKAKAISKMEIASQDALKAQKLDLESLFKLRSERQVAEISEVAEKWERKAAELDKLREMQLKSQSRRHEEGMEEALQMQREYLEAASADALRSAQRTKIAAIKELKAEFAGKWKAMEAAHDQNLREVKLEAERLVQRQIARMRTANRAHFSTDAHKGTKKSLERPVSLSQLQKPRVHSNFGPMSTGKIHDEIAAKRILQEEEELAHIEAAKQALDYSHHQDELRAAEVKALRETSKVLKMQLRKAMLKEQDIRAYASRRAREDRLHQKQKVSGVGNSGKKIKSRNSLFSQSEFSPRTRKEIEQQSIEVKGLKLQLAIANAKIDKLSQLVERNQHTSNRNGYEGNLSSGVGNSNFQQSNNISMERSIRTPRRPRTKIEEDEDLEVNQILNWLNSPAGEAAAAAAASKEPYNSPGHSINDNTRKATPPLSLKNKFRPATSSISLSALQFDHDSGYSSAIHMLELERKPLHAIFVFYANKRKMMTKASSKLSRRVKSKPTMFMTDPDFNRFCFDFNIVPGESLN